MPAPKAPSQRQAARQGGKKLKREGAIADLNVLYEKVPANPDRNNGMTQTNNNHDDLMDIDR